MTKKVLILGANGFIGSHLIDALLEKTDFQIRALDLGDSNLHHHLDNPRLTFVKEDVVTAHKWIQESIEWADTLLPLVAIANPALYVKNPLKVFELDFQSNLPYIELCLKAKTHLLFPSTSEVYGMCPDKEFDETTSPLVLGPIQETRWIYSCIKQLLDRVIHAYGEKGLNFTLFRPFNWIGPRLDSLKAGEEYRARALTRFMADVVRQQKISLVNGGEQRRCFIDARDGISALIKMIENPGNVASGGIFNIGRADQEYSMKEFAETLLDVMKEDAFFGSYAEKTQLEITSAEAHYGKGYADVDRRVPKTTALRETLNWSPVYDLRETFAWTLAESAPLLKTKAA